jgi:hypothetical protein
MSRPGIEPGSPHSHSTQLVNRYSEHLHISARPVENACDITLSCAVLKYLDPDFLCCFCKVLCGQLTVSAAVPCGQPAACSRGCSQGDPAQSPQFYSQLNDGDYPVPF